jgi:hypothetical protein
LQLNGVSLFQESSDDKVWPRLYAYEKKKTAKKDKKKSIIEIKAPAPKKKLMKAAEKEAEARGKR